MSRLEKWKVKDETRQDCYALYVPEDMKDLANTLQIEEKAGKVRCAAIYQNFAGRQLGSHYLVPPSHPALKDAFQIY